MDPKNSGAAVRKEPGGEQTSGMAVPLDELSSSSSKSSNTKIFILTIIIYINLYLFIFSRNKYLKLER